MAKEISLFRKRLIIKMSNRNFYSLILLGVLILLGGGFFIVNALTPGVAPNPGHLITQVAPPAGCGNGQVLQFIDEDNGWGCVVLPVDTDDQTLSVSGQTLSISEGNSVAIPSGTVADGSISQSKLKTSIGSVNVHCVGARCTASANLVLPGGEYGFYPQVYSTKVGNYPACWLNAQIASETRDIDTYATNIWLSVREPSVSSGDYAYTYARQRYITSSGEVFWIFILRDKETKEVISMWQAPDHPCFGNGGDPEKVQHPFIDFDQEADEIVVIVFNPDDAQLNEIKSKRDINNDGISERDLLEVIAKDYEIDEDSISEWPTKSVTVGLPEDCDLIHGEDVNTIKKTIPKPDYIKVKTLKAKK